MSNEQLFNSFVKEYSEKQNLVEAIAIADGENVLFRHHFTPNGYPMSRCIYSHTKSFTSTAVGFAVDEGLISLDDRVEDLFPEYLTPDTDPEIGEIRLRDFLTMRSGFGQAYLMMGNQHRAENHSSYVEFVLSRKLLSKPGTVFTYSNGDTHLAACMLEKKIGRTMEHYLWEKFFLKSDIGFPTWEHDPEGHTFGASALYLKITDQLKLGQLYLSGGKWGGEQILSESWAKEASSPIVKFPNGSGYGYQFWIYSEDTVKNAFKAAGAYGQETVVLPDKGLVVSIQCPEYGDYSKVEPSLIELLNGLN